jgi:Rrf2 family transcriptional regulator, iron-sulfur cluster assembly transcription factor
MILSTRGEYALRAIIDLMHNTHLPVIRVEDVAKRQNIPVAYLESIFHKLKKADIIASLKGPGGGYNLKRSPKDLTVLEIVRAVGDEPFSRPKSSKARTKESSSVIKFFRRTELSVRTQMKRTLDEIATK